MELTSVVRTAGGVVPSAPLRAAGASSREISHAIATGALVRPRRGWLALPDADPMVIAAARDGVVLTCVTQARRLGLWVLGEGRPHVAAPNHAGRTTAVGVVTHWRRPTVPRLPGVLEDGIQNVLVQVAMCQPHEVALAVWESALQKKAVDADELARLPLPQRARAVLALATPWSDSGLETFVVPRLRWLRLPLRRQIWIAGHRVDVLIGDRLALQIDGGHHVGAQRDSDNLHDAALALLGYHVIRVGYELVIHRWEEVQDLIMRAVAQGLHRAAR